MGKATVIPFGPQHPVLPEPLHLDLVVEDEKVIDCIPQIGVHSPRLGKARGDSGLQSVHIRCGAYLRHLRHGAFAWLRRNGRIPHGRRGSQSAPSIFA